MSKNRNICILTQPLSYGYGGLMQAYALQKILKKMGHTVHTEDRRQNTSVFKRIINNLILTITPFVGRFLTPVTHVHYTSNKIERIIYGGPRQFKLKYLTTTEPVYSNEKHIFKKYGFDTYIVGSDQVWRPKYMYGKGSIYNYFLDFTAGQDVKRIAYAASFGVEEWEFSDEETSICKTLLKQFDATSVRENIGISMCKNHFGVTPVHVLDPTLLLEKEDYITIAKNENETPFQEDLFCFFLDDSEEKEEICRIIAKEKGLKPFSVMPKYHYYQAGLSKIDDCKYAPVSRWLRAFMDAKFVVTDSFHGTVFSIIFNKPVITIANSDRGLSRFTSLLKIFNLENRLIYSPKEISRELLESKIDYNRVNRIKKDWQEKSMTFLQNSLQ